MDDLKLKMAERGIFVTLFMSVCQKNESCQALLLNFFKLELIVAQEDEESSERLS